MRSLFIRFNLFILISLFIIRFGINPVIENYAIKALEKKLDNYFIEMSKGPFYMTIKYLENIPQEKLSREIKSIQKEFGFPVDVVPLNSVDLAGSERQDFEKGKIIGIDEWSIFYQRIGKTDWALEMGPFKDFEETVPVWMFHAASWITLIFFGAFMSLMWAFPFWRNLKKVMDAANHFGDGRFDARADLGKRSPLKPMADTFNDMAERIGGFIKSHKLLVNAVSHELRTPISRIRFGMAMLESSESKEDITKYISGISQDVDDLESLVSELLTYAGFDKESDLLRFEEIEVVKWFREQIEKVKPLAGDIDISVDFTKAPEFFSGDSRFLGRALENLILNAIKYTETEVSIKCEQEDNKIIVSVKDNGPGIPEKDLERVFEPFVRLDESRSRESGGYGLGLAIVSQIMSSHRGEAIALREGKKGGLFVLTWPAGPPV